MLGMDDALSALASNVVSPVGFGVLLAAGLLAALLAYRRRSSNAARLRPWRLELQMVCDEAGLAVDELLPQRNTQDLPPTAVLTAIATRLRLLDEPLTQLIEGAPTRVSEAAEDIGQVTRALRAALQAERRDRIDGEVGQASRSASTRLVIERTTELEMAIQAARRLIDLG